MVRSYYPSECHADYFDFERIEALKPAIEACGISTLSQSPMLGFHKQMDNRIKLLEEILSFRFFFSSRRRHTRWNCDWSSDVCSSDLFSYAKVEQTQDSGLMIRVAVPVNSADRVEPLRVLQVIERVPKTLAQDLEKVQAGARDYQEISFSRAALKRLYQLTLTLTLLLALTSALGLAVVLSERFAAPLGLLAAGTRAVAEGDFTRRQPVTSRDELGVLTQSFNTMTAQLSEAQQKTEESRRAIETTSAYLESILG